MKSGMKHAYRIFAVTLAAGLIFAMTVSTVFPAAHPRDLEYPELNYQQPEGKAFRTVIGKVMPAFIAEDHTLPIIDIALLIHTGQAYDPMEKTGISELTARSLINGGTTTLPGAKFQEELDYLGIEMSVEPDTLMTRISISGLSRDAESILKILTDILVNPAFETLGVEKSKIEIKKNLQQQMVSPYYMTNVTFNTLMYGDSHPLAREMTPEIIDSLTVDDLKAHHRKMCVPGNAVLSMSGDFNRKLMIKDLNKALKKWKGKAPVLPEILVEKAASKPGVYIKPMDLNQGFIKMGHPGIALKNPDYATVEILSYILGAGSFSSRLMRRVRSDEGLAYSVYGGFDAEGEHRGLLVGATQTKSVSTAFAISIFLEEFKRAATTALSAEEMTLAKDAKADSLASHFYTKFDAMGTFATLEMFGLPLDHYTLQQDKYLTSTVEQVQAAGEKYIHPDDLIILIVGDPETVQAGDGEHPVSLTDFGPVTVL